MIFLFASISVLLGLFICFLVLGFHTKKTEQYIVQVLKASQHPQDKTNILYSFYLKYPRMIHAEMLTHKDFSRSASSSRAIPVKKILSQVWNEPAMPLHWGVNRSGMQAFTQLSKVKKAIAKHIWVATGRIVCCFVWVLSFLGLHKQVANRLLEPWQFMHVTLTTNKLNNFFTLRTHQDAQPEIQHLARCMQVAIENTNPVILKSGEYHIPWIKEAEYIDIVEYVKKQLGGAYTKQAFFIALRQISAARCARSSYGLFDGTRDYNKDIILYDKLVNSKPVHASPTEHQAYPDEMHKGEWNLPDLHGNLPGWIQHRKLIKDEYVN